MQTVLREYTVHSRKTGRTLVTDLAAKGYDVKLVMPAMSKKAKIPETSYYQIWSDDQVTRDDNPLDMPEILAPDFKAIEIPA